MIVERIVSIRFEVRGGFRQRSKHDRRYQGVSIRFEVRGGFRRWAADTAVRRVCFNPL